MSQSIAGTRAINRQSDISFIFLCASRHDHAAQIVPPITTRYMSPVLSPVVAVAEKNQTCGRCRRHDRSEPWSEPTDDLRSSLAAWGAKGGCGASSCGEPGMVVESVELVAMDRRWIGGKISTSCCCCCCCCRGERDRLLVVDVLEGGAERVAGSWSGGRRGAGVD